MNIKNKIHEDWLPIMNLLHQEPLKTLSETILPNISYQPKADNIFKVFEVPINSIKVVILGQDPFPTPNDAIGLSFINGINKIPVSLKNIFKEIIDSEASKVINQYTWQEQGVFLLNTALTVETGKAGSHLKYWEDFTKRVINHISINQPCIWLLWGKKAEKFMPYIKDTFNASNYSKETIENIPVNSDWNYLLIAPHPAAEAYSGGTAGFFGCNHFYYTNKILSKLSKSIINW